MHLRAVDGGDAEFLLDMLLEAFNWRGDARFTRDELVADGHADRYLGGWGRAGDFGLVAVDGGSAVGAIWARTLTAVEPGYGYVADDVPELGMAVRGSHRGRGVGSLLLLGCIAEAQARGIRALSLSVEDGNSVARSLYERHGFAHVGRVDGSDTLLCPLG